jgi:hypothetical protein
MDATGLPVEYEKPRYFTCDRENKIDTSARWPGWDGWYFFVFSDDKTLPVKMIRASLMTGLYGLEGIDNYERISMHLPSFKMGRMGIMDLPGLMIPWIGFIWGVGRQGNPLFKNAAFPVQPSSRQFTHWLARNSHRDSHQGRVIPKPYGRVPNGGMTTTKRQPWHLHKRSVYDPATKGCNNGFI